MRLSTATQEMIERVHFLWGVPPGCRSLRMKAAIRAAAAILGNFREKNRPRQGTGLNWKAAGQGRGIKQMSLEISLQKDVANPKGFEIAFFFSGGGV
jgi:hypothetical protein